MNDTEIFLFGKLRCRCRAVDIVGLEARKVQELLCYLLIYRTRPHSRDVLANLLWEDKSTGVAKKNLRHTLWQLQAILDQHQPAAAESWLTVDADWVGLNLACDIWLDVAVLESVSMVTRSIPGEQLNQEQYGLVRDAVQIYTADLLEGWYSDWCIFERERFQSMYLSMLDQLMRYCLASDRYAEGLVFGNNILRYDRARERTHRSLMQLHYLAGDRTAALRQYHTCVEALTEELDVPPAHSTQELYARIRDDALPADPAASATHHAPSPQPAPPTHDAELNRLYQMQSKIADLQFQLEHHIRAIHRGRTAR